MSMDSVEEKRLWRLERTVEALQKTVERLEKTVSKLSRELENTTEITLPKKR